MNATVEQLHGHKVLADPSEDSVKHLGCEVTVIVGGGGHDTGIFGGLRELVPCLGIVCSCSILRVDFSIGWSYVHTLVNKLGLDLFVLFIVPNNNRSNDDQQRTMARLNRN